MVQLAQKNASALGAGHCFIVFLGEGYYPVNVYVPKTQIRTYWWCRPPTRASDTIRPIR
jgi:adenosine/AMP kinase